MKKIISKILSVFLAVAMVVVSTPLSGLIGVDILDLFSINADAHTEGNFIYSIYNGEATLTGCIDATGDIVIPSTLGGYPVTSIGERVFYECDALISISMPESITEIGYGAFAYCCSLASVIIPDSVESIDGHAFCCCESLTSIIIPANVKSVGGFIFIDCYDLESVIISEGVTSVGEGMFAYCENLKSVTLPDSVENIGYGAFYACSNLNYVHIPSSVTNIDMDILCDTGAYICSDSETCYVKTYADENDIDFSVCEGHSEDVYFKTCGDNLFWSFNADTGELEITGSGSMWNYYDDQPPWSDFSSAIKSVNLPDGLKNIGEFSFNGCTELKSITIPDSVEKIGWHAFGRCTSLSFVDFGDSVEVIDSSAFYKCTSLETITFPDSLEYVSDGSFDGCVSLKSVNFGNNVKNIGYQAFNGCEALVSISLPDSIKNIENQAFYNTGYYNNEDNWENDVLYISNHLIDARPSVSDDYEIKHGTKTIADCSFLQCTRLTSVTIPYSVINIGDSAFEYCDSLENFIVDVENSEYSSDSYGVLYNKDKILLIQYPNGNKRTSYTISDVTTSIGDCAFQYCNGLTSVTIPDSIKTIGSRSFYYCENLASITIGDGVTSIDQIAFYGTDYYCDEGNWEKDVLYIGDYLIDARESISGSYEIKDGTRVIADAAFADCYDLNSVIMPDSVINAGDVTFFDTNLEYVHIPSTVMWMGDVLPESYDTTYICSDSLDCKAKEYADEYGIKFVICTGHGENHEHSYKKEIINDVTCTDTGEIAYVCYCGDSYTEIIPILGHTESEPVEEKRTEPTCIKKGSYDTVVYCSVCDEELSRETTEIPALGHGEKVVASETLPTCTEEGVRHYECSVCGYSGETDVVHSSSECPQSSHNYANNTNITKSFSSPGAIKLILKFSSKTQVENIYDYIYIYKADGSLYGKYTGTSLAGQTIELDGDSFSIKLTSDVSETYYGYSFDSITAKYPFVDEAYREVLPALGHTESKAVEENRTEATCTEKGSYESVVYCSVCGEELSRETKSILAKGHKFGGWVVTTEPTMTTDGVKVRECSVCGETETGIEPKTGITITLTDSEGKVVSETVVEGNVTNYSFSDLADGEYTVTVSKETYVAREYQISATDGQVSGSFKLNLIGDINGDGKVNTIDVARANAQAKGVSSLADYEKSCADINGDGRVNTLDVARMNAHAKGVTTLW